MAIAVESTATENHQSIGSTLTITKPSGLVEGDLLFAVIGAASSVTPSISTESGWTSAGNVSTFDRAISFQYKVADSSDVSASNFTFDFSSTDQAAGIIYRISGQATSTIIEDSETDSQNSETTVSFTSAVDPTYDNSLVIIGFQGAGDTGAASASSYTTTPSITFTESLDTGINAGTNDPILAVAHGIYSDNSEITAYGVTLSKSKDVSGGIVSIRAQADATGTFTHIAVNPTVNSGAESSGTHATLPHLSISPTINSPTAKGTSPTNWTNQSRSSTTWTNQNKS